MIVIITENAVSAVQPMHHLLMLRVITQFSTHGPKGLKTLSFIWTLLQATSHEVGSLTLQGVIFFIPWFLFMFLAIYSVVPFFKKKKKQDSIFCFVLEFFLGSSCWPFMVHDLFPDLPRRWLMTFEPLNCFIQSESPDRFGSVGRTSKDWRLSVGFKMNETVRCIV